MTTIAYDGKYLVADRQCSIGNIKSRVNKLYLTPLGIAAITGDMDHGLAIVSWLQGERRGNEYPVGMGEDYAHVIVIDKDKRIWFYDHRYSNPVEILNTVFSSGSGGELAMGALLSGKSAIKAVEIASAVDTETGMGVSVADVVKMTIKHI